MHLDGYERRIDADLSATEYFGDRHAVLACAPLSRAVYLNSA
jgi:hypothetical protein